MLKDEDVTLFNLALVFIGSGLISWFYYFPLKREREGYRAYLEAKLRGEKPTDEMIGARIRVMGRRVFLALIVVGLMLLGINYLIG